jgi:hypothetical protein
MCLNETYSQCSFPFHNGLKQGDALSPLLFNFSLECVIRNVQENEVGLKVNGTHQLLTYTEDVNLLGDNRRYKENTKNSVTSVCEKTIPTKQPPLVGEVTVNFCA